MEARKLGNAVVIEKIRSQHDEQEHETAELQSLFERIYSDQVVPVSRLKETFDRYLDLQFQHLETGDHEIFPVMKEGLSAADWGRIEAVVDTAEDLQFRLGAIESYSELSASLEIR